MVNYKVGDHVLVDLDKETSQPFLGIVVITSVKLKGRKSDSITYYHSPIFIISKCTGIFDIGSFTATSVMHSHSKKITKKEVKTWRLLYG